MHPQTISAYKQDNLSIHHPPQADAQITRAYFCATEGKLPRLIALMLELVNLRKVKVLAYNVPRPCEGIKVLLGHWGSSTIGRPGGTHTVGDMGGGQG